MIDKSTVLSAIKMLFSAAEAPESILESTDTEPQTFVDVMTVDGITLRVTDMVVGASCMHVDAEGVETACEEGTTYELEDGTKIVIGADSTIAEIMPVEAEPVEVEVEMGDKDKQMYSEETEETVEAEAVVETVEEPAELTEQEFANVTEIETLRKANVLLAEEIDALRAEFMAFAKAPSADALSTSTTNNVATVANPTTRDERLAFFGKR
jgi:hypothetical protein